MRRDQSGTYEGWEGRWLVSNLALLVTQVLEDKISVNDFARSALQVQEHCENWFRQLSSEAMKRSLVAKFEMFVCI